MRMHYWSNVLRILRGIVGAEVIVTSVPGFVAFPPLLSRYRTYMALELVRQHVEQIAFMINSNLQPGVVESISSLIPWEDWIVAI